MLIIMCTNISRYDNAISYDTWTFSVTTLVDTSTSMFNLQERLIVRFSQMYFLDPQEQSLCGM